MEIGMVRMQVVRREHDDTPVRKLSPSTASTAQTDCECPTSSHAGWKSFHTLAVLEYDEREAGDDMGDDDVLIPRPGNDCTVGPSVQRTDILGMSEQGEIWVLLRRGERVCVDDCILTARYDIAFPLPLSNLRP